MFKTPVTMALCLVGLAAIASAGDAPYVVDDYRPEVDNKAQALNLAPSVGAKPFGFYGYAWIHILDADNRVNPNFGMAHLGINDKNVVLGSIGMGTTAPKPVAIMFDQRQAVKVTEKSLEVPAGNITIARSSDGVALELFHKGKSMGRITIDANGAKLEGFTQIDDLQSRLTALEQKMR